MNARVTGWPVSYFVLNVIVSGGSKNLKIYEASKVQCNLCGAEVSLKKLERHKNLRCRLCGHHHHLHGQVEHCCNCVKRCLKCAPLRKLQSLQSLQNLQSLQSIIQTRLRCDCGHYHAYGSTCNSLDGLSQSNSSTISKEHHSDSDSTVQSLVIDINDFSCCADYVEEF